MADEPRQSARVRPNAIGKRNKPPTRGASTSTKNSWTSPARIKLAERRKAALDYRRQGYTYRQIADEMRSNLHTVHEWVVYALNEIVREPAVRLLTLELDRLDELQSAYYSNAVGGDVSAAAVVLKIMDARARLLHWHDSSANFHLQLGGEGGERPGMQIRFVMPSGRHLDMDDDPPPQLPGPRDDILDLKANKPSSGVPLVQPSKRGHWMD